ncbi:MAG: acyl carrier protein [Paucimonas sp.]|jgi:acyl carrier protein|uniref:acyl carrier protein n=1 Tax=Pantoea sp. Cy-639 TaxID=2608360 RepID=UPI00141E8D0D|nr:acyl carrier protein [Pantoea sp. Cy-639]MDR2307971.1 acyl carrier protein [Paucimonas sp.]NIF16596.1 acyl carrier protein [Pantoea sp. Cy-639]
MTQVNEVFDVVRNLILDVKDVDESDVTLATTLEALELDSLDFVEMQVVIKKKFAVSLNPNAFEGGRIPTLQALCDYVLQLKSEAVPA